MSESLDRAIEQKFRGMSDDRLIEKIESGEDFKYDDEAYELTRRLAIGGAAWRWSSAQEGNERVIVFPTGGQTVQDLSEPEVIALMTNPALTGPKRDEARDEYYRRRGEVIDAAIEERRAER